MVKVAPSNPSATSDWLSASKVWHHFSIQINSLIHISQATFRRDEEAWQVGGQAMWSLRHLLPCYFSLPAPSPCSQGLLPPELHILELCLRLCPLAMPLEAWVTCSEDSCPRRLWSQPRIHVLGQQLCWGSTWIPDSLSPSPCTPRLLQQCPEQRGALTPPPQEQNMSPYDCRSSGHATPLCTTRAHWLFWAAGTGETANARGGRLSRRNSVTTDPLPGVSPTREQWLLSQDRRLEITTPWQTLSQMVRPLTFSSNGPVSLPKNHLLSPRSLWPSQPHFPY